MTDLLPHNREAYEKVINHYLKGNQKAAAEESDSVVPFDGERTDLNLERQEKAAIIRALEENNNDRRAAARSLGVSERTVFRKVNKYGIEKRLK